MNTGDQPAGNDVMSGIRFRVATCHSSGIERLHNEDTIFSFQAYLAGISSPVTLNIFLVADGMGGHRSGEIASRLAAKGVVLNLVEGIFASFMFDQIEITPEEVKDLLRESVDAAQNLILNQVAGGGTTLTFVLALDGEMYSAHVGDSRLYLYDKDHQLNLLTKDHSLVKRLVDLGEISLKEAKDHPQRNVLYRALGQSEPIEPDIDEFSLEVGERLLICSDGLWGVVEDQIISDQLGKLDDIDIIAQNLVRLANQNGGPDNISVVIIERIN
jgi:serine/threonine protein phosphatase PrpC